jgi:exonuclease V gamma subunit
LQDRVGQARGIDPPAADAVEHDEAPDHRPRRQGLVRLLGRLEEASENKLEFRSDWIDSRRSGAAPTVLTAVQDSVLHRGAATGPRIPQDRSLQVAGCPSALREVEAIYNSILWNMKSDDTLQYTDIAVLVPDMAEYKTTLLSVFGRDPAGIPFNLTDSSAVEDSLYARGLMTLLGLAGTSFSRAQVFELVFNPCFMAAAGLTREHALEWLEWADRTGVFHSFDKEHRVDQGYEENEAATWQAGLKRLRLGQIMDPASGGAEGAVFEHHADVVPYADADSPYSTPLAMAMLPARCAQAGGCPGAGRIH